MVHILDIKLTKTNITLYLSQKNIVRSTSPLPSDLMMGAPTSRTNWEIAMRDWRAASIYVNYVSAARGGRGGGR